MQRREAVDYCVIALAEVFGQIAASEPLLEVWTKALSKLTDEEIESACTHLLETRTDRRMPVPADVFAAHYGTHDDAAQLAWNTAFRAILTHPGRYLEFEDPIIAESVREIGGVSFLSNLSPRDLHFQRKPFISTYKILCKNGDRSFNPVCRGQYNTPNNKPVLISKNEEALQLEAPDENKPPF